MERALGVADYAATDSLVGGEINYAALMRTCAPLYPSFALESAASLALFFFFSYLSVLISAKQQIQNPAQAMCKFVCWNLREWASDTARVLSRWPQMHELDMGQRFRFCRRLNATICRMSATFALISITRWLHVNNVNGFRYLSYAITCPLMQAELVLLIAPVVPCFRIVVVHTALITSAMLFSGYAAGQFEGDLWTTSMEDVFIDGNFHNLSRKGWQAVPSMIIMGFLSFVQIPTLYLLYICNGGGKDGKLPAGYPTLLMITSLTWLGFPLWWFLSFEGASIITDTKLNSLGFVSLNAISKGSYTLQMISMVGYWKRTYGPKTAPAPVSDDDDQPASHMPRKRGSSMASLPELPEGWEHDPEKELAKETARNTARNQRKLKTNQSLDWFIKSMKEWDVKDEQPLAPIRPMGPTETVVVCDPSELTDEQLVQELQKRLANPNKSGGTFHFVEGDDDDDKPSFQRSIDDEIRLACSMFIDEQSEDE